MPPLKSGTHRQKELSRDSMTRDLALVSEGHSYVDVLFEEILQGLRRLRSSC